MSIPVYLDTRFSPAPASDLALDYVRAFGSGSLAYSAVQQGMQVFEHGGGAIAYRESLGHSIVLGDPLCAASTTDSLLDAFLATHRRAIFAQISRSTGEALARRGFHVTPVGCDTELDVARVTLAGSANRELRRAWNKGMNAGLTVTKARDSDALRFEMRQLSDRWLRTRRVKRRELSLLVRPLERTPEPGARIFVAHDDSRLAGFVIFDPRYRAGCNVGYAASTLRAEPGAPSATLDFIVLNALQRFKSEGVSKLSLGVMPFHDLDASTLAPTITAQPLYHLLRFIARTDCAPFLNIHGLNFHKSRYRPQTTPVYLAARSKSGLLPMTLLTRACGLLP